MSSEAKTVGDRFAGKRVIVTGASAGIGKATAIAFAAQGATVAIIARRKAVLEEIVKNDLGGKGFALEADFSDLDQVTKSIQEAIKLLGGLDVLVNNVGGGQFPWFSMPLSQQIPLFNKFNLDTAEFATEAALPALLESKGSIVNVGSIAGIMPAPAFGGYSVAKAALHQSSKIRAHQLARKGVNVNVVAPGTITSEIFTPLAAFGVNVEEMFKARAERHLDGRNGSCEEVAATILFLSEKKSSGHITGHVLPIDGGATIDSVFNIPDQVAFSHNY